MRGTLLLAGAAALTLMACLDRDYKNPFLTDDPDLEDGWEEDRDGNGISDSVEYYARGCDDTPRECLRIARDSAAAAREREVRAGTGGDSASGKTSQDTSKVRNPADTADVERPKDTVIVVQPKDTVVVVQPKDTVIVVQPKDTVIAVTGIRAAAVYVPMGVARVTPSVTVLPQDAKNRKYSLTSLDEAIVKVSGADLVPVKPGKARVRARTEEGGFTAEFEATVVQPDTNVYETAVAVAPLELTVGDAARAPAVTWTPGAVSNKGYSLVSGDPKVVEVVVEGSAALCRPVSPGKATVTLTTRGKGLVATFQVTVKAAPILVVKALSLTAADLVLAKGGAGVVPEVTVLPAGATDKTFTLASSNPKVVAVSGNRLQAVSGGKARITATSPDGPSVVFQATVRVPVESVSAADLALDVGETATPAIAFQPADADNQAYTLASGNAKIVAVEGRTVTAVKKGSAEVTVTAADGSKTFRFKVKVGNAGNGSGDEDEDEDEDEDDKDRDKE